MNEKMTVGQMYTGIRHPGVVSRPGSSSNQTAAKSSEVSFESMLQQNMLKFSNHAAKRLEQRGIQLGVQQLDQINSAVEKAAAKGSKESLILMKDLAFIVNIPNRTVVTALDGNSMKNNVFTQIDSTVVIS
ncbi:flagellar biosynthesis protein [Paenibacillus sp. HN-1]|uniref:TIGR02530 family flagellar biosynthesis protein n=1 Tax=Paenibacillus TaxID=44249 RepID=UPI001CA981F2|nr:MULTISPECIES: TIGR02530 family flagellar biosynthesis protein [Paenibacillus]MBY9081889.1 flagellar biosynthesis protein [Paenibacillus sp. CGMCC 1.18879]MBY9085953.1 flagellar biosynthesis protein [Paenibacillus sinensis]